MQKSSKTVENSSSFCTVAESDAKDRALLLVTAQEGLVPLPVVVRRFSEDGKVVLGLEQVVHSGFRKIEPKPRSESKEDGSEESVGGSTPSLRLLESKSTRRGVRICPTCQGRVGYRSKVCKHCRKSGSSTRSTANVKTRNARQQKNKASDKRKSKAVGAKTRILLENTVAESSSSASIEDFDVQISDLKSDGSLIYVNVPTNSSDLETISNIDTELNETTDRSLSLENECQVVVMKSGNNDIVYKEQTHVEMNGGEENGFDKGQNEMVMVQSVDYFDEVNKASNELSQNQENCEEFQSCRSSSISSLSAIPVEGDYEELAQNVEFGQVSNSLVDSIADGSAITMNVGENLRADVEISDNSTGDEKIGNEEEIAVGRTSERMNSEDQSFSKVVFKNVSSNPPMLQDIVSQNEDHSSPALLVDGNSIGSVSVTKADENSQNLETKAYNMETTTLENAVVFENTHVNPMTGIRNAEGSADILAEIKQRSEQRGNVKQKRKQKFWQELHSKRKKGRVSSIQFVRIEPKPFVQASEDPKKNKQGTVKQNRLLPGNPTRRGVMLCPLCQKEVGCRSRTCKYCKVTINSCTSKSPLDHKNLLAVQLCKETCPEYTIISVKKTFDASEDRCFVKKPEMIPKTETASPESDKVPELFSCDCLATVESSTNENPSCEHTICIHKNPKITKARNITLKPSDIGALPIDVVFKHKLGDLWEAVKDKEFPLVQQVCQNTLVVLDVNSSIETTPSCVHVRFEKIKRRSITELHIFCSGTTCSAWNEVEAGENGGPVTCLHYCVSLWAIACDDDLQKYFKVFLDATQVYLHSEVFENTHKE